MTFTGWKRLPKQLGFQEDEEELVYWRLAEGFLMYSQGSMLSVSADDTCKSMFFSSLPMTRESAGLLTHPDYFLYNTDSICISKSPELRMQGQMSRELKWAC
jgi:hypothetical protein